jgi:hypothetical protein
VNRAKMKMYDLEAVAQSGISQANSHISTDTEYSTRTKKLDTGAFQF